MKKPDVLLFLAIVVALGSAITGMASEERKSPTVLASEYSIR
ncbi:MAG: hypothetical protein VB954_01745 [Thalassolituus sp.]|jgi:hypothetical protein|uniref:Uncharacterized protein n=2 Tax=root TaxID=1 RepID=M5DWQ4_9GAMM|nr:hypothetical protein [Thalassolituus oleivorans]AHK17925.1 hypothetical protein R615_16920 [Thalassolituus oleivorans R6-15]MDF1640676.1 hypothetical protein [Thalassolituus oleivorans]CCU74000.1 hypothetical protein TOL_3616 [Thalassolituus oleivorans MIL-1]|tara:strand:+ start:167 stop:292 length:126 start_codon:yes stop_codon:yes gene_type:complete